MKCAIHQPQFLPWLGYLAKLTQADVFVFLDDVQFKKNEFQNRNKIRVGDEARWVTVPVSFNFGDALNEVHIAQSPPWQVKLHQTIEQNYTRASRYQEFADGLWPILDTSWPNLSELNIATVEWLMTCFDIDTETRKSSDIDGVSSSSTQRLVDICRSIGADTYLSGVGGRDYLDVALFEEAGIQLEFQEFLHPSYSQCYTPNSSEFVSHLSAIDGLFCCGGGADSRSGLNIRAGRTG